MPAKQIKNGFSFLVNTCSHNFFYLFYSLELDSASLIETYKLLRAAATI